MSVADVNFEEFLAQQGYSSIRMLPDGRWTGLFQFMFTWAIIVGRVNDYNGYDNRWCYSTYAQAKHHYDVWDGQDEPQGWKRHPLTGRYREEPSLEQMLEKELLAEMVK